MLLRLSVALLVILGALFFAAPQEPAPSRAELAALRAERQRSVQLSLPDRPAPVAPSPAPEDPQTADTGTGDDAADAAAPSQEAVPQTGPDTAPEPAPGMAERDEGVAGGADPAAETSAGSAGNETDTTPDAVPLPEPAPEPQVLYVTGSTVNLRAGPSTDNAVMGQVTEGQSVELVERLASGWVEIRVDGVAGTVFMSGDFLSETP